MNDQCTNKLQKIHDQFLNTVKIILDISENQNITLCSTCARAIKLGSIPKLALSNGFEFPKIPDELKDLTTLEERMVSARLPFMQIRSLGVDRQCGLYGNVVNIFNPVDEAVHVLPRSFDSTSVTHVMLMRKLEYNRPYLAETVRPIKIFKAAKWLADTDLYKEENIHLSLEWYERPQTLTENHIVREIETSCAFIEPADCEQDFGTQYNII